MPAITDAGPAAAPVFRAMEQKRIFVVMPVVAVLTILSGARLMWLMSGGFSSAYFATPTGATLGASGAAAVTAFLVALLVSRPAGTRAGELAGMLAAAESGGERADLQGQLDRVRRRASIGGRIGTWLLVGSAAGMAVARYVSWVIII